MISYNKNCPLQIIRGIGILYNIIRKIYSTHLPTRKLIFKYRKMGLL